MTLKTQMAKLGLFDAKVPRYTSYPTAPHFSPDVGADFFTQSVAAIPEGAAISLYLHVPFCRRLCWFCACRTQGTQTLSPVQSYVQTLLAELTMLKARLPASVRLSRLHWGGGTPTLLSPEMMQTLCEAIFDVAPLAEGGEFSVEIDPNEVDADRLAVLVRYGMNRASVGMQDFDPQIQETIGRPQSYALTREVVQMIRAAGVQSLNADILFGLPDQTPERIKDSVEKLIALGPDRVALYGYAHVPWMAKRQQMIPADRLPTPQERLGLYEGAEALFTAAGYDSIGIDHFALPSDGLARAAQAGRLRRNFQGYTDDQADVLIGLGASAISRFPQGYAQNAPATSAYATAIAEGRFATSRGHVMSVEDQTNARLIERLMCDFSVDAAALELPITETQTRFEQINARFDHLLQVQGGRLDIPTELRPLTRMVARAFDTYAAGAQHSAAI